MEFDVSEPSTPPSDTERVQVERLDLASLDLIADLARDVGRLVPSTVTETGLIDFERLRLALGDSVDIGKERYGMAWPGKAECFKTIQSPSLGTLRPSEEESINFESTENLIIEGDNLEVLKLLQKSYLGKIKAIYIDPPYNTGNDFIYPDDYSESLETYLRYTGQVDDEGLKFGTNTDTEGRFHSNWLNMMYPRLYLARNLLQDAGILFVSIDDVEFRNLKAICDEVFGEENHVTTLIHQRAKGGGQARHVVRGHDYILGYARSLPSLPPLRREKVVQGETEVIDGVEYLIDDDVVRKKFGKYDKTLGDRRCFYEELVEYKGQAKKDEVDALLAQGELFLREREDGFHVICRRIPVSEATSKLYSIIKVLSEEGKKDLEELGLGSAYDYPKPVDLLRQLVRSATSSDDVVLDFFAGSGTTAHAILELNKQDGGDRKFILVQLPEPTGREDYPTIADITEERVRRVIKKLDEEDADKLQVDGAVSRDRGFRVFKLAESNFTTWDASGSKDEAELSEQLELHVDHIREGRTEDDLLFELLLKSGFPLTTTVQEVQCADATVHSVAEGALLICLERKLSLEAVRAMAELQPERVVCLDEGFANNDQLKANAVQIFKSKNVPSFKTV